jgi:hypothetical protein
MTLFGGGAKTGDVQRGIPQRRGPQFTPDEMIARQEQLMRDLSKLDMSDPAKSVQALGYLIASADAMQMFTKGKPAEITKSEPEFKLKQPEPLKLDINVYADERFNAQYRLRSEGTKKDGRSKKAKAKPIHRLELGVNQ